LVDGNRSQLISLTATKNGTQLMNLTLDYNSAAGQSGVGSTAGNTHQLISLSGAGYAYDHENRRFKKTIGSSVTHYVWQNSQVLAEHNGITGAVLIDYVYSTSGMIGKVTSGTPQYFLSDTLSLRLALDSSGNVLGRQRHLPFGAGLSHQLSSAPVVHPIECPTTFELTPYAP